MPQIQSTDPMTVVRIAQIITVALVLGASTFGTIGLLLAPDHNPNMEFLAYIGLAGALFMVMARIVIVKVIAANMARKVLAESDIPGGGLASVFLTKVILGGALLEGAAFFNFVCYIITGSNLCLAVGFTLVAMIAIAFPLRGHFVDWVDQLRRELV
ncbi:hypothetical protein GC163_24030 [bacterium]|nr:hypothetical protein [bacterium]